MNDSTAKSNHLELSVVNLYYPPDQSATAQLLGQWCEALSHTFDLTLTCGSPTYDPNGVRPRTPLKLNEIALFSRSRTSLFFRILNYALFTFGALFKNLFSKAPDAYVCWTDPPWNFWMGFVLKKTKRTPLILVMQDVYPDILFAHMPHFPLKALIQWLFLIPLKNADHIVVIGEDMKKILIQKGIEPNRLTVIPNWHDENLLSPTHETFRETWGLSSKDFVVMHAGNLGFVQDFDSLIEAAKSLQHEKDMVFILVGHGARKNEIEEKIRGLSNVKMFPYQDEKDLAKSLSTANIHYVSLKPQFTGLVVPSKLYGIMAVGKPVVAVVSPQSDTAHVIQEAQCGWVATPQTLHQTLQQVKQNSQIQTTFGNNGLQWFKNNANLSIASKRYVAALQKLMIKKK